MCKYCSFSLFISFCCSISFAQDSSHIKVINGKKYLFLGRTEHIALYKNENSDRYYFSTPLGSDLKKINYFRIIHKNATTFRIRENCRELRRKKIKLHEKHADGEYYIFKVFK